ncbi:hypothetical protein ACHAQJ_007549 [Trichoderma viride]
MAAAFIPVPVADDSMTIDVEIEWDTSQVPQGTRTLSSFGKATFSQKELPFKALSECVLMVGQINSFIPPASHNEIQAGGGFQGIHWLGTLPDNLSAMKKFTSNMFPHLSAFFKDDKTSYQIFMRKVSRGLRATPATGGTLIDYDDDAKEDHDCNLVRLFNMSLIATWAHLDSEDDGICHLYTIYLPYRFGQRSADYFRATLNGYLSSYFTNPFISYPVDKIPLESWYGKSALAMRSCIYMIRMDCFTRRASVARSAGVLRPIDEIVADIRGRRLRGEQVQTKDWLKYLGDWIGEEAAQEHFQRMRSGEIMDLEDMKTSFDGIQPDKQRVVDLGFDESSFTTGIVSGVKEHSEAAKEGLKDGDKIVWHSKLEMRMVQHEEKFYLLVDRDGKRVSIEFWPRSDKVVKGWVSRKKQV